jgi:hypothetical protein
MIMCPTIVGCIIKLRISLPSLAAIFMMAMRVGFNE